MRLAGHVDPLLTREISGSSFTHENVNLQTLGFEHVSSSYQGITIPSDIAGERLGNCVYVLQGQSY